MNDPRHSLPMVEAPAECALIVDSGRPLRVLAKLPSVAREELAALRILIRQTLHQTLFPREHDQWSACFQRLISTSGPLTIFYRH